jgi:NADH dehydrogenase FAD-containing subunit
MQRIPRGHSATFSLFCCQNSDSHAGQRPSLPRLVLAGGGHAHCHVIRTLNPQHEGFLGVLVSIEEHALYSGMLPGRIARQYTTDQVHIDLVELAARCGWLFLRGRVTSISRQEKRIHVLVKTRHDSKPQTLVLHYEALSIDVGSETRLPRGLETCQQPFVISTRPILKMETFMERFIQEWTETKARNGTPLRLVVMGGGAAGAELSFALLQRFHAVGARAIELYWLVARPSSLPLRVQRLVEKLLQKRALTRVIPVARDSVFRLEPGAAASEITTNQDLDPEQLNASESVARFVLSWSNASGQGRRLPGDLLVLATGAAAPAWLAKQTDLAVSDEGYVLVRPTLQSFSSDDVFAAGDCIAWGDESESFLPKAGVFAVRQAPVLSENLRRRLRALTQKPRTKVHGAVKSQPDRQMCTFQPQRSYLSILNTADGRGIAYRGQWMVYGRWVWHWKNFLDQSWMARYPRPRRGPMLEAGLQESPRQLPQKLDAGDSQQRAEDWMSSRSSLDEQCELAVILWYCAAASAPLENRPSSIAVAQRIENETTRALAYKLWQRLESSEDGRRELALLERRLGICCQVSL